MEEENPEEQFEEMENDLSYALELLVDAFMVLEEVIQDKVAKKLPYKLFKEAKTIAQEILCFTSQWPDVGDGKDDG